ncbi:MAG: hypothetical protein SVZ03_01955 [Spirochaetota bacterium]|nr:hypothetical protein [Spirochaetota bacterium]
MHFFIFKWGIDISGDAEVKGDVTSTIAQYNEDFPTQMSKVTINSSGSIYYDIDNAISISAEFGAKIADGFGLGIGVTYQIERGFDEDEFEGKFQFIPIYGLVKFGKDTGSSVSTFATVHAGYNFFLGDDDFPEEMDLEGGLYWGIGMGLRFSNGAQIEFLYSVNEGSISGEDVDIVPGYSPLVVTITDVIDLEFKYTKLTLSGGYVF